VSELELVIEPDGTFGAVYDDALRPYFKALGPSVTERAAHVEPMGDGWQVNLEAWVEPTPSRRTLGPFTTRAHALEVERLWIAEAINLGRRPN